MTRPKPKNPVARDGKEVVFGLTLVSNGGRPKGGRLVDVRDDE